MISRPPWYDRVKRHPDYNDEKIVLVDTNAFSEMAVRERWDEELSFLINSSPAELRIKLNRQTFHETLGPGAETRMRADLFQRQRAFVEAYRRSGKIMIDDGLVPFFTPGRFGLHGIMLDAIMKTGNISKEDAPIVTDALVNRIPLFTRERRLPEGIAKALNNRLVRGCAKANGLWEHPDQVLLR